MEPSETDHHHHLQQRREHLQGFLCTATAPPASSAPPDHVASYGHAWQSLGLLLKNDDSSNLERGESAIPDDPPIYTADPVQLACGAPILPHDTSMVHDLGVNWPCGSSADFFQGQIERAGTEELPDCSFLKLACGFDSEAWSSAVQQQQHFLSTGRFSEQQAPSPDVDVGLLERLSTARLQLPATAITHQQHQLPSPGCSRSTALDGAPAPFEQLGNYTKMLLSASTTPTSGFSEGSFSMQELQALELLASARFGSQIMTLRQSSLGNVAFFGEGVAYRELGHLPSPSRGGPSSEPQKMSSFLDGVKEGKRANSGPDQYKATPSPGAKRARPESRSSTPPLKQVRKEKLGDRVAALQQLVAPFGKTDTASVLTEAVGYIKFLQGQVQALSMPYLRSSGKSKIRTAQGGFISDVEEAKQQDLRSRGLCLVPLSYTSYFTGDQGGATRFATAWSSSDFSSGA